MTFEVKKAEREAAPVTIAISGQSGSGKTYSALLLARGMVGPEGKIAVIDTEGRRSLIYADDPDIGGFHHIHFAAPWSSARFTEALRAAEHWGADAIIIDSASHEHEAEGGMLDFADAEERRLKGKSRISQQKWIKPKMAHNRFVRAAKSSPAHIIFCIRLKVIIDVDVKPAKELFLPVCDRDLPFELDLSMQLETGTHAATFIKVPKPFLAHIRDKEIITVEHGRLLMAEAGQGKEVDRDITRQIAIARDVASMGTAALKKHFEKLKETKGLVAAMKAAEPGIMEALAHTANTADAEASDDTSEPQSGPDTAETPEGGSLVDEFSSQPEATPDRTEPDFKCHRANGTECMYPAKCVANKRCAFDTTEADSNDAPF